MTLTHLCIPSHDPHSSVSLPVTLTHLCLPSHDRAHTGLADGHTAFLACMQALLRARVARFHCRKGREQQEGESQVWWAGAYDVGCRGVSKLEACWVLDVMRQIEREADRWPPARASDKPPPNMPGGTCCMPRTTCYPKSSRPLHGAQLLARLPSRSTAHSCRHHLAQGL